MRFDPTTLFAIIGIVGTTGGLLLLFSWLQERTVTALALWGVGLICVSTGVALVIMRAPVIDVWTIYVGPPITYLGYGLMWCGARSFEGRRPLYGWALAGAAAWLFAAQFDGFVAALTLRMSAGSLVIAAYTLAAAFEYWHARDKELISRWPAIVLLLFHAVFFAGRAVLVDQVPFPGGAAPPDPSWPYAGSVFILLHYFCMAFLVMNMAKERAELQQRKTALVDPLTGAANRRAFFESGERLLRRTAADSQSAAVLLLDLDLFKQVNDTFGHQTGDRVLCAFCETATAVLRPTDVFARLGGEEFACLLPGVSGAEALRIAERVRVDFERRQAATVSIGVATTSEAAPDLTALIAAADRALYQAKAMGRNRVERAQAGPAALRSAFAAA